MAPFRRAINNWMAWAAAASKVHEQVLDALLSRGWCHSYHFTDQQIVYLGEWRLEGRLDEIDEFMAEFTRRRVDVIRATARAKFPVRAPILSDAFDAHISGKYTLSIPAFLAQLDGIGCEVFGLSRQFFVQKNRERGLSKVVGTFRYPWDEQAYRLSHTDRIMLSALERRWSLGLDTNERTIGPPSQLNRHGVLHGLDTDYPTELNSLRCILLLGYVLEVREVLWENIPRHLDELARGG